MSQKSLQDLAIYYGGDYNPEQWDETTWQKDMRLMKEAGVNLVTLGVFSWAKLEPRPGEFDFGWFNRIIQLLTENDIGICLATATASPPPWFASNYPSSLPITMDGVTLYPGGRQQYCPHSLDYRRHAETLVQEIAQRYGGHLGVKLWHINNEYACHVPECFCDESARQFRKWLQEKYAHLDALNHAWGTAFWSQQYADWNEIHPPRSAPTFINPTQQLDWRRFSSDSLLELFEMEKDILCAHSKFPITTNFMQYFKPLDYWKWAAREDVVSLDCYPDPAESTTAMDMAFNADLMRSLGEGDPWILMEQAPSVVNWREINLPKSPGQMRLLSLQAQARGANGILFFQWRQSKAGAEKFHSAMVPHGGRETRVWNEVKQLGLELKDLSSVLDERNFAQVAILMDWENWWALELDSKPAKLSYQELLVKYYEPLFKANILVDFAHPCADLTKYKLVIAPSIYLSRGLDAKNISRYVQDGGVLVISFFSGIVDENEHIHMGGYPGPFRELLGLRVDEFVPLKTDQPESIDFEGKSFKTEIWSEVINLEGANAQGIFTSGFAANKPAITYHSFGKGKAYYISTLLEPDGIHALYTKVFNELEIHPIIHAPAGVEIVQRGEHIFLLNHNFQPVSVRLGTFFGKNLLGEETHFDKITLGPNGAAILQK